MDTPVVEFVQKYLEKKSVRFHMPGHKGQVFLGCEPLDITEIDGADVLAESQGILGKSQKNAALLFGVSRTFYSTEGSSLSIRAMLMAAMLSWREKQPMENQKRPWVLAGRNVHRAMIDACALLDLDVEFLPPCMEKGICTTLVDLKKLTDILEKREDKPIGVYLTSPDYLGVCTDIGKVAGICHSRGIPLLVDNAHGAYLAFLEKSKHPISLGADLCCDSAHKTLPVLTGGGYLHIAPGKEKKYEEYIRRAMSLFGSTSPSYLILQSLDLCNQYLAKDYKTRLKRCIEQVDYWKQKIREQGICVEDSEPLKIVLHTSKAGYTGQAIADEMRQIQINPSPKSTAKTGTRIGIESEYADENYLVWMMTPENTREDFEAIGAWLQKTCLCKAKSALEEEGALFQNNTERVCSIRQAVFAPSEMIEVSQAEGRILAQETVSCPPAIPICISGEKISKEMVRLFEKYKIHKIAVLRKI